MVPLLDPEKAGDHLDRLFRAAWALCGDRDQAEDLVQETYAVVLSKPRLLRNDDDLGYLLRALRNTFHSQHRRTQSRPQAAIEPEEGWELIDEREALRPDAALEARELYAAINRLPDEFREVLVAVDVAGLEYKEAAAALKIPEGTVMSRLYRARRAAAKLLA